MSDIIYESLPNRHFKNTLVVRADNIEKLSMNIWFETKGKDDKEKLNLPITKYFCEDGTFLKEIFRSDLRDLHNTWVKKNEN